VHHVAVLDDIFLAFLAQLARIAARTFAAQRDVIVIGDGFGADEAALEIEWISPAACGALAPLATVQARASLGPTVKKVSRPSRS
jgi:hypothetical protein